MLIDPCPEFQKYLSAELKDTYGCACENGHWQCALCYEGQGSCVLAPDGGLTNPLPASDAGIDTASQD